MVTVMDNGFGGEVEVEGGWRGRAGGGKGGAAGGGGGGGGVRVRLVTLIWLCVVLG